MNDTTTSFVGPNVAAARDFTRHLTDLLRNEQGALVQFLFAVAEPSTHCWSVKRSGRGCS